MRRENSSGTKPSWLSLLVSGRGGGGGRLRRDGSLSVPSSEASHLRGGWCQTHSCAGWAIRAAAPVEPECGWDWRRHSGAELTDRPWAQLFLEEAAWLFLGGLVCLPGHRMIGCKNRLWSSFCAIHSSDPLQGSLPTILTHNEIQTFVFLFLMLKTLETFFSDNLREGNFASAICTEIGVSNDLVSFPKWIQCFKNSPDSHFLIPSGFFINFLPQRTGMPCSVTIHPTLCKSKADGYALIRRVRVPCPVCCLASSV